MNDLKTKSKLLEEYFKKLRFDQKHHLGMGDIRLTIAHQEEILEMVKVDYQKMFANCNLPIEEAEKKARELYPIEDFPFREDAEFQEEKQQAFIEGANWQAQQSDGICSTCGKYRKTQGNGILHQLCECGAYQAQREVDVSEWFAKETNRNPDEFDDYDNYIVKWIEKWEGVKKQ